MEIDRSLDSFILTWGTFILISRPRWKTVVDSQLNEESPGSSAGKYACLCTSLCLQQEQYDLLSQLT